MPTLMEILLRLLGDTCHILPSILRYTPTFIDIVYMCKGVPILFAFITVNQTFGALRRRPPPHGSTPQRLQGYLLYSRFHGGI